MKLSTVKIIYKSGAEIILKTDDFAVERKGSTIESVTWGAETRPVPLHLGINEIAAIFEL